MVASSITRVFLGPRSSLFSAIQVTGVFLIFRGLLKRITYLLQVYLLTNLHARAFTILMVTDCSYDYLDTIRRASFLSFLILTLYLSAMLYMASALTKDSETRTLSRDKDRCSLCARKDVSSLFLEGRKEEKKLSNLSQVLTFYSVLY